MLFRRRVEGAKLLDASELNKIDADVMAQIENAVKKAKAAPKPTAADLMTDVYVSY